MTVLYPQLTWGDALRREGWVKNKRPDYATRKKGELELIEKGYLVATGNGGPEPTPSAYELFSSIEALELLKKMHVDFASYANDSQDKISKLETEKYGLNNEIAALHKNKQESEDRASKNEIDWRKSIDSRLSALEEKVGRSHVR